MRLFSLYLVCLCTVSADIMPLLEFKKGIRHDPTGFVLGSWNDESIDFNGCPSTWNGIICDSGNVVALVLDDLGLSADVDLGVFVNLTMLAKLSMSNNSISGKLPDNLGSFKSLEYFDVSNNLFFSSLPVGIGELALLKNLSLAGNNFSGPIPDSISGLSSIGVLDMSRNALSGPLPLSVTRLGKLRYLNLSINGFSKRVPRGFELMEKLDVLDLHGNAFEGEFDPEFLLLTTASYVDFSGNLFGGKFRMGMSESVKYLNLSNCGLTGSLVTGGESSAFGSLEVLDLSYNQLSGELPGFNFVYDLQVLRLGNNGFSGPVPNGLLRGGSLVLTELDLSGNNLSGPISTITSTTLHILNLSSNVLSGELPPLIGSCAVIDLSRNKFQGNLSKLLKWDNVEVLDLSQNQLTGFIPEASAQFLRLNYLNLSGNSLIGSLPKEITLYPKLMVLDLGFNLLNGPLSSSLLTSSTLKELHLQSNKFSGSIDIPNSYDVLLNLQVLDLSNNLFNGRFVDGFGRFMGLQLLNIGGNNFSGNLPDSICNISSLVSLDVSRNHFTGELPGKLSNTLRSFNASYNNLSGVVPENLRMFPLSSFYPGNSGLKFPNPPRVSSNVPGNSHEKRMKTIFIIVITIASLVFLVILILLAVIIRYKIKPKPKDHLSPNLTNKGVVISTEDVSTSQKERIRITEVTSPDEKTEAVTGFSPAKNSSISWSPGSGDSSTPETNLSKLESGSPDRMVGELNFLDDTISFTSEELSRAPAEVLGRSCHGTSYKATLDNGLLLTVKWLREGVTKQRKEFSKEAKKFANIRHPNVVGLRGYYWGPTKHEKLLLSDYISPGSLASFLYDRPGRKGPLTWAHRLKIAVDTARGLNYLHFDRGIPHGNLKSTNVLLDGAELNAKVSDYCLHRLMIQSGTVEQILDAGVLGYRAPELAGSKKPAPSFKSDVYAFGVILLELLTGKCGGDVVSGGEGGVDLTDWVRLRVAEGRGGSCFDGGLVAEMGLPGAEKGMQEVLGVALRCIRSVSERPGIKTVYEDLSSV